MSLAAVRHFAQALQKYGCILARVDLPQDGDSKVGLDDYLLNHTYDQLVDMTAQRSRPVPPFVAGSTADEIMRAVFEPTAWVIASILPEGLAILAGKSKLGKSWLAPDWAIAVAAGGCAMGIVGVEQGSVLYLALEDTKRRLQGRLKALMPEGTAPRALAYWFGLPHHGIGRNLAEINTWLDHHRDARLVVVDTLGKVRPVKRAQGDDYSETYAFMSELQNVAKERHIALVVVHHTRKAVTDDAYDDILGSTALMGACDTVLVLRRGRGAVNADMHITGRDVDEQTLALSFDAGHWRLEGDANVVAMSDARRAILAFLQQHPKGASPTSLAKALGKERSNIQHLLTRMVEEKLVVREQGGLYKAVHSIHAIHSEAESTDSASSTAVHSVHSEDGSGAGMVNGVNRVNGVSEVNGVNGSELFDWSDVDQEVEEEGTTR